MLIFNIEKLNIFYKDKDKISYLKGTYIWKTTKDEVFNYRMKIIKSINNSELSLIARLAGAPNDKEAGVDLLVKIGNKVKKGDVLFVIHSKSLGNLEYALNTLNEENPIIKL